MVARNPNVFFIFFFAHPFQWIFSSSLEYKFFITNVPSLLRCERHGPLFYFSQFPTDNELAQAAKKKNSHCDSIVPTIDARTKVQLNQLELSCDNLHEINDVNTFMTFSSICSKESCRGILPESAHILRQLNGDDDIRIGRKLYIHYSHSNQIIFQESTNDRVKRNVDVHDVFLVFFFSLLPTFEKKRNSTLRNGDIRTDQLVFEHWNQRFYSIMCE